ncbi:plant self-incompatibility protein S1 family [Striga asiatica]|uniref:Plant self-incompatibility protein S1 family n=1 Tax=Striga asiatica TaxID=4170 RepID=A0A5A7P2L0_STRAF|nr:plant self-incompatibility protein S1 family [Striga asiatica]
MNLAILLLLVAAAAALMADIPGRAHAKPKDEGKTVVLTNNHTNYLSIRCFSFDDNFDVVHLQSGGQYMFKVHKRVIYPSSTMFNCSTNMGTFVAYKYNYDCTSDEYKTCDWKFDEESAYRWEPKQNSWVAFDYSPNYESLNRGNEFINVLRSNIGSSADACELLRKGRGIERKLEIGGNYGMGGYVGFVQKVGGSVKKATGNDRVTVVVRLRNGIKGRRMAEP